MENECEDLELVVRGLEEEIRDIMSRDELTRADALEQHKLDVAEDRTENLKLREELEKKLMGKKE